MASWSDFQKCGASGVQLLCVQRLKSLAFANGHEFGPMVDDYRRACSAIRWSCNLAYCHFKLWGSGISTSFELRSAVESLRVSYFEDGHVVVACFTQYFGIVSALVWQRAWKPVDIRALRGSWDRRRSGVTAAMPSLVVDLPILD
jgi:hypothetical protein